MTPSWNLYKTPFGSQKTISYSGLWVTLYKQCGVIYQIRECLRKSVHVIKSPVVLLVPVHFLVFYSVPQAHVHVVVMRQCRQHQEAHHVDAFLRI